MKIFFNSSREIAVQVDVPTRGRPSPLDLSACPIGGKELWRGEERSSNFQDADLRCEVESLRQALEKQRESSKLSHAQVALNNFVPLFDEKLNACFFSFYMSAAQS